MTSSRVTADMPTFDDQLGVHLHDKTNRTLCIRHCNILMIKGNSSDQAIYIDGIDSTSLAEGTDVATCLR